jgi:hypothetical protein
MTLRIIFIHQWVLEWNRVHYYWGHLLAYCTSDDFGAVSGMNCVAKQTEVFGENLP